MENELTIKLKLDTTEFNEKVQAAIEKLESLKALAENMR